MRRIPCTNRSRTQISRRSYNPIRDQVCVGDEAAQQAELFELPTGEDARQYSFGNSSPKSPSVYEENFQSFPCPPSPCPPPGQVPYRSPNLAPPASHMEKTRQKVGLRLRNEAIAAQQYVESYQSPKSAKSRFLDLKRRMAEREAGQAPQDICEGEIVREEVIQKSVIENGEIEKTTQHITTRLDANGCERNECRQSCERSPVPRGENQISRRGPTISALHTTPFCCDPYMLRLHYNVERKLDLNLPGEIVGEHCPQPPHLCPDSCRLRGTRQ